VGPDVAWQGLLWLESCVQKLWRMLVGPAASSRAALSLCQRVNVGLSASRCAFFFFVARFVIF
jgi:hypothetical protein